MARLHLALLLLVAIFAVIVSAADKVTDKPPSTTTASAPTAPTGNAAEGPTDDNAIGTTDDDAGETPGDDDVAVAGPIGSDTSYANYPPPQQTSGSGVTEVFGFSSIVVATVGSFFFF
ncbi:Anther-specific protein BCP1 [Cardamine amara subsp. amara]|uniref:Anther-specific protein BCP1 n=1 Tax=Cardamine amara subsp. amara TaxID=228776 RepID=A0ABD1A2C2_CARAN